MASVLKRIVPLINAPQTTPFSGCTVPLKVDAIRGKWRHPIAVSRDALPGLPAYQQPKRPAALQYPKKGRVVLWKMERMDGCGSNSEYQLLTWALAHHMGWVYGGELPNAPHTTAKSEFVFMQSDCSCMNSFLGLPTTLHNRIENEDK
jgi:hypothetical protein